MKLAALDVGTNTVLMLVAETTADRGLRQIAEMSRITRLGRGVDANGNLDSSAEAQTLDAIAEFTDRARTLGAERIVTAATAALRDARDGAEFLAEVKARTGLDLEIVSGETEAQLSYLASVKGLKLDLTSELLIVDIGGGSTELIRAQPGSRLDTVSLQIGSVRLTERIVNADPPSARDAAELRVAIDEVLDTLRWNFIPDVMVGIAGTVTTVCAVALGLVSYDSTRVHGHELTHGEVMQVLGQIAAVPLADRKKIPGIEPGRADVIFAGTAILERVMAHFKRDRVIVSDQGVRWGLLWRELDACATVPAPQDP
jgi:exopolyphosphatase/guanosine-5'-triphosphate,3'-diphosphate pyrophosphatase